MDNLFKQRSLRILTTIILLGSAAAVNAQPSTVPAWAVSKDVQKVANKQLFEDENLKGSHIHAVVLSPTWNISKGVNNINRTASIGQGNITSGSSDWNISKGVQKIQRRSQPEKKNYFKPEDQISRNGEN